MRNAGRCCGATHNLPPLAHRNGFREGRALVALGVALVDEFAGDGAFDDFFGLFLWHTGRIARYYLSRKVMTFFQTALASISAERIS